MEHLGATGVITDDLQLTKAPTAGHLLVSDANGNAAWATVVQSVARMLSYSFSDTGYAYIQTTSATWVAVTKFIFPGTGIVSIANVLVAAYIGGGTSMDIRIVRFDTGQVITSYTGITADVTTVFTMSTPTNVPAVPTVFEIQAQALGPNGRARLSSILLY